MHICNNNGPISVGRLSSGMHIHSPCVVQVMNYVPTAPTRIIQLAAASAPFKFAPLDVHCLYLRGIAHLAEGPNGATVRNELLATMVNQLIAVDIEIKWQDIVDAMGKRNLH